MHLFVYLFAIIPVTYLPCSDPITFADWSMLCCKYLYNDNSVDAREIADLAESPETANRCFLQITRQALTAVQPVQCSPSATFTNHHFYLVLIITQ